MHLLNTPPFGIWPSPQQPNIFLKHNSDRQSGMQVRWGRERRLLLLLADRGGRRQLEGRQELCLLHEVPQTLGNLIEDLIL